MPTPKQVVEQINAIVSYLVETGLANDQNFAHLREVGDECLEVSFPNAQHVSIALKDRSYSEIYNHLRTERSYNILMPDGAIMQMMYLFAAHGLERHRLAFFPSPHLDEFQSNPEIYIEDVIYADVISRNIVPFPVRFDHDSRDGVHVELLHPKSHLTLGQYANCRIPVSAPLTPFWFADFVLRNFYNTAYRAYCDDLPTFEERFVESIHVRERQVVHLQIPT